VRRATDPWESDHTGVMNAVVPRRPHYEKDTVDVAPSERYNVIWIAREPGKWLLHCHIPHRRRITMLRSKVEEG